MSNQISLAQKGTTIRINTVKCLLTVAIIATVITIFAVITDADILMYAAATIALAAISIIERKGGKPCLQR